MSIFEDQAELAVPGPRRADATFLRRALSAGGLGQVQEVEGGGRAWLALACSRLTKGPLVVVLESTLALEEVSQDLTALGAGEEMARLPAVQTEGVGTALSLPSADVLGERTRTLQRCLEKKGPGIVVTCVQALMEQVMRPTRMRQLGERVIKGQEYDLAVLAESLALAGYAFEAEVLAKGQAARRGGLLDVWPLTEDWPVRLEFFGNQLESLRRFDPNEQRSREEIERLLIAPVSEGDDETEWGEPADYFPENTSFLWVGLAALLHHYAMSRELAGEGGADRAERDFLSWRLELRQRFARGGQVEAGGPEAGRDLGLRLSEGLGELSAQALPADALEAERAKWFRALEERAAAGWRVDLFFATEAGARRFREAHGPPQGFYLHAGTLSGGFELESAKWMALGEADIYGTRKAVVAKRRGRRTAAARDVTGERLANWTDLTPGELVVHVNYGIGKYLGLYEILFDGQVQESLAVEYAEGAKLYVPTSQIHLLSRYVGVGRARPPLHKLGSKRWLREKKAAEKAATDLAAQMLETQAQRAAMNGHAFAPDSAWQHDFEQSFPFEETDDQLQAVAEVKQDMESRRPMDRLICGDVGYGKTEVAMRAAFKAVADDKQVAVLVPTTVLAQQHYETFLERMGRFPIVIEMLSRFRTKAAQKEVLERLASKRVDVVIGTHRMLSRDVRFADLGLVIIDEEQRFGVAAKEHLKQLRLMVDVLTLSATPIPRTLYLSLTGARDMSVIQTAPRERLPIETYVVQDSDELVREVILREVNRGGQVFMLHNRVQTIDYMRARLERLLPGVSIGVGHGQMTERALAKVMRRFVRGEYDVLLCTTIIASGVDIPNVNTILIDRADRFGMADLYQLRGRVGRSKHQAYAYLLLPRHGHLFTVARQRIQAIKRHTSLGAGFRLALRDLEIRGAGNVLGEAQSGHIAAVGFDLYCQLLNQTIARLKGDPQRPVIDVRLQLDFIELTPAPAQAAKAAVIPREYIEDESLRIQLYRKVAGVSYEREVEALAREFRDRFGPLPAPLRRLLALSRLRILAASLGLQSLATDGDRLLLGLGGHQFLTADGRHPRLLKQDVDERLAEIEKRLRQMLAARKGESNG